MAAKKRSSKKKDCRGRPCRGTGQFKKGGGRVKRGNCAYKGQMAGSTKGGRPKRRRSTECIRKRRKATAKKRPTAKRTARKRTKGVMSHGHMVYGAAAKAVKRKRARKGKATAKRRRERPVRGHYGRTISGGGYEFTREELRQLERM